MNCRLGINIQQLCVSHGKKGETDPRVRFVGLLPSFFSSDINWHILRQILHLKGVVLDAGPGERGQVLADGLPEERLVPAPRDHAHADERRQQRRAAQPHVRRERVEPQQAVQVE